MIEVFITNVKTKRLAKKVLKFLESQFPLLNINFDLEDFNKPYPCGHSILRVEGDLIDIDSILNQLEKQQIKSELLTDDICV